MPKIKGWKKLDKSVWRQDLEAGTYTFLWVDSRNCVRISDGAKNDWKTHKLFLIDKSVRVGCYDTYRKAKRHAVDWMRSYPTAKGYKTKSMYAKGDKGKKISELSNEEIEIMLDNPMTFGINPEEEEGRKKYEALENEERRRGIE